MWLIAFGLGQGWLRRMVRCSSTPIVYFTLIAGHCSVSKKTEMVICLFVQLLHMNHAFPNYLNFFALCPFWLNSVAVIRGWLVRKCSGNIGLLLNLGEKAVNIDSSFYNFCNSSNWFVYYSILSS